VFVFAHVSDVHFDGTAQIAQRTERVMRYLTNMPGPIDAILVTGDIADHGADSEYVEALEALASPYPVVWCPGNHDERRAYRRTLLGVPGGGEPINEVRRVGDVTFMLCDSTIPGSDDGFLADETIDWLDAALTRGDGPAFVCFHHPPVGLGQPFIDELRMRGEARLAALVRRHPRVVALLCGHAHTAAATTFAGRPLLVAPGVKSTLLLPFESPAPLSGELPPAFAFHLLDDDLRLTTHYRVVG
jgi:3',5'-cyclic AMP phosphodiesterase CpdA